MRRRVGVRMAVLCTEQLGEACEGAPAMADAIGVERNDGSIVARGVIAREPGQPGVVEEFTIDAPGPGEALVRILASGVCHTDLSAKNGVFGTDYFPFLLRHEGAGIV